MNHRDRETTFQDLVIDKFLVVNNSIPFQGLIINLYFFDYLISQFNYYAALPLSCFLSF